MPIKPEEIDPSKLPVAFRGYDRDATDELLKRVAWDYRQASRVEETWSKDEQRYKAQVAELEALVASQRIEFAQALAERDAAAPAPAPAPAPETSSPRIEELEAEVARLQRLVHHHERRRDLTQTLIQSAQRAARELRESARQEAETILKAAHKRADEIEHGAHAGARHAASEIERLQQLETDLRDRLRHTLEAVIGQNGDQPAAEDPGEEPEPQTDTWSSFDSH